MIHALLQVEFDKAVSNPENHNEDGSINWNFVDSDCYMAVGKLFKDSTTFYEHWNDLADKFEAKSSTVDANFQTSFNFNKEDK